MWLSLGTTPSDDVMRGVRSITIVVALGLTACSDSSTSTQPDGPLPDDGRTQDQIVSDQKAADASVLTLDDFPSGWEGQPAEESEGPDLEEDLAECLDVDPLLMAEGRTRAESDTFIRDQAEVDSSVAIQPTVDRALEAMSVLKRPQARECYEEAVQDIIRYNLANPSPGAELPDGVEVKDVTVGNLNISAVGDDSQAFRVTVTVEAEGLTVDVYVDVVGIRVGRATGTISFVDVLTPFDDSLATELAQTLARRMAKAQEA